MAGGAARQAFQIRRAGLGLLDQGRGRILARIGSVEPRLIGEDDHDIGFDKIRDQRAERIVVAELNFLGGNRVVLVDDRHPSESTAPS